MGISLRYDLVGAGWSRCVIQVDDQKVEVTASYLSDALDGLAMLAVAILQGHPSPRCSFAEEPGEYRWIADRISADRIRLRILEFAALWGNEPDERGKVLLDAECRIRTFAGAVLSELQRLKREVGPAEYARQWVNYAFPSERIDQLRTLLAR